MVKLDLESTQKVAGGYTKKDNNGDEVTIKVTTKWITFE
jgi:hypothetical protein